ncbi:transcriptional regulator [Mycolicibacterium peregrinum]|uniref:helix-turn-helix transcriptional regulator n=1 Tax=Mycolicibacterium peregrinum TaxID=43304 RepID=UPI0006D7F8FD|nr:helix-turn-helix transcriptional regulator [Mycolicibacterium peregrinum]MCV7204036.1 helix-turn-helix domain-containing protein [Mycolicibacterium peregrinum]ORW52618.1 DNA-binding protein [Mycolicibacterium peregrinum]OWM04333.1 transcriptional regulator [Mycolicibacterium peregrinum]
MKREQLSDFLRTRRARLKPADVGLVVGDRRRTPGLRREEVALLAGVGTSWYTWLEQGRDINVSSTVLDAISTALQLSEPERSHLYSLSGMNPPPTGERATEATPELLHLLEAWSPRPAMLQDQYWNLLAVNEATRQVFGYGDTDRNCLVTFFTNSRYRAMYVHWAAAAPGVVSAFRADAARYPDDVRFAEIVDDLGAVSPEFVELWGRHDVGLHSQAVKAVLHPQAGELVFDKTTLAVTDHPGWHLVLYNPRPGTGTDERLDLLMQPQSPNGLVNSASSSR